MDSLLFGDQDEESTVPESVLKNLLVEPPGGGGEPGTAAADSSNRPLYQFVIPEAGLCLKTKSDKGEKVFINICKSEQVPSPRDISDEEVQQLVESGDATKFRVPLSLGEPHTEKDNAGKDCQAYDVIISSKFFDVIEKRPVMKNFLLTLAIEGLEDKYNILLSRDCTVLKNRKFIGALPEQTVRQKPKPFIIEVDNKESGVQQSPYTKTQEMEREGKEPVYTLLRDPVEGDLPQYLVMEVQLPGIGSSRQICLEVGEDRLRLSTRPKLYLLHLDLPYLLDPDSTGAQFNIHTTTLTATLHVTGLAPTLS